jgi:hypothetical protein
MTKKRKANDYEETASGGGLWEHMAHSVAEYYRDAYDSIPLIMTGGNKKTDESEEEGGG